MISSLHTFHIPVMGLAFTIDTPLKVARFGISSVISIIDDELIERMRKLHCSRYGEEYTAIDVKEYDSRARRITEYLNLVHRIVIRQTEHLRTLPFEAGNEISQYFELLPEQSELKQQFTKMLNMEAGFERSELENSLRSCIQAGSIDVNIMAKVDNVPQARNGEPLPDEFSDALSALRGFARSDLTSSIVFSAGYNPRLYAYIEKFPDFFPDLNGNLKKKVILKVSDLRSARTQGMVLARKGVWVSEFRIESGLNCGGHAFATQGLLLGPILEEFKAARQQLAQENFELCNRSLQSKGLPLFPSAPALRISAQGGIGTADEHDFLLKYYQVDSAGWGSPFLLVPEVTNVDADTRDQLAHASKDDYYLSNSSPLGIPFNNFRTSSANKLRQIRIEKGRPGSPCYKKYLQASTEFGTDAICTASRQYQEQKIRQLQEENIDTAARDAQIEYIEQKECLCEGLGAAALLVNGLEPEHKLKAVSICPGPNLAYFSGTFSMQEMVGHIYKRWNILNTLQRSHVFINELRLYVDFLKKEINALENDFAPNRIKYLKTFKSNLCEGIAYYVRLFTTLMPTEFGINDEALEELQQIQSDVDSIVIPELELAMA